MTKKEMIKAVSEAIIEAMNSPIGNLGSYNNPIIVSSSNVQEVDIKFEWYEAKKC